MYFFCNAQTFGLSVAYVPWGREHLECTTFSDTSRIYSTYEGYYSFGRPAVKLAFEIRKEISTHLIEVSFSSINSHRREDLYTTNYKMNQLGLVWHPGWTIMPKRRVQIPLFLGFGLNYYWGGQGYGGRIPSRLYFDLSAMGHIKVYATNWLAFYGGYSAHVGLNAVANNSKSSVIDIEFRHYPEIGVSFNF